MDLHNESSRIGEVFFALCKSIDTPISLGAWLRFKYNQLALAEMALPVRDYLSADAFRLDYAVVSFLSKGMMLNTGLDLEAEALRKFTRSELLCKEANDRIKKARYEGTKPFTSSVLYTAKRKIAKLLGSFDLSAIELGYGWGPGATNDVSRRNAFVDTKVCKLPISCTHRARPLFEATLVTDLHWSAVVLGVDVEAIAGPYSLLDHVFNLMEECKIDTVPKNAKTHRVIAKEPRANGFLQKGIGRYIRRRLKRVGIDLDDQSNNQRAAKAAYVDHLATLDLKAASDSMPIELVYELLPLDWACALDAMRSPKAEMPDGEKITLQKFSSMGNGFTFELETLVFWAICGSVASLVQEGAEILVYGDDIICPSAIAADVVDTLAFCGFQVNEEKSYVSGNFYESCGEHYFKGEEVTPVYQKEDISSEVELLRCGNRLIRLADRFGSGFNLCKELFPAWNAAWRNARDGRYFQIPFGDKGDDGWLLPADYFHARPQDINLGIKCNVIVSPTKRLPACDRSLLAWTLRRGVETEAPYQGFVTSSPETTMSSDLVRGRRWVMPSGEFGVSW